MAVPFFDLTKKLVECGADVSYGDVLLMAEFFFISFGPEEWKGKATNKHHETAARKLAPDQFVIELVLKTVNEELTRRAGGAHEASKRDDARGSAGRAEIVSAILQ